MCISKRECVFQIESLFQIKMSIIETHSVRGHLYLNNLKWICPLFVRVSKFHFSCENLSFEEYRSLEQRIRPGKRDKSTSQRVILTDLSWYVPFCSCKLWPAWQNWVFAKSWRFNARVIDLNPQIKSQITIAVKFIWK